MPAVCATICGIDAAGRTVAAIGKQGRAERHEMFVPPPVSGCSLYSSLHQKVTEGPRGGSSVMLSYTRTSATWDGMASRVICLRERHSSASRLPTLCACSEFHDMQYGAR